MSKAGEKFRFVLLAILTVVAIRALVAVTTSQDFVTGFCRVEFLCHTGDPNWLGWGDIVWGVIVWGGCVGFVLVSGAIGLWFDPR